MIQFFSLLAVAVLTGIDQLIKHFVYIRLRNAGPKTVIPGVFQLHYSENDGAMMGLMQGKTTIMIVAALVILVVLLFVIFSKKVKFGFFYCCLVGIIAGGFGNIIDRIFRGFVIDYIEVTFVDFYIFNFADCLVTAGAFLIIFYEIYEIIRDYKQKKEKQNG